MKKFNGAPVVPLSLLLRCESHRSRLRPFSLVAPFLHLVDLVDLDDGPSGILRLVILAGTMVSSFS